MLVVLFNHDFEVTLVCSSYMYLDREKKVAQYRSPAIFDSIPPPGDPVYQRLGMVEGLVNLWAFIVERYVVSMLCCCDTLQTSKCSFRHVVTSIAASIRTHASNFDFGLRPHD